jgi:DNA repair exonuclease SbcCD nuclease subunit
MKILFIGDPHLKINKFELAKQFLNWIESVVVEYQPDLIVNLGDTFNDHATLRSEILTEFMAHVDKVRLMCPYVYLLGNHDMWKHNDSKYHALKHLKDKIPRFHIIDEIVDFNDHLTFVPYQPDLSLFPTKTKEICIAHQTFKGSDFGSIVSQEGVDAEAVSAEIIISGHIHKRQILGKVYYPGSPFAQNINDIDQIKGVDIFCTETYKFQFIENPLPKWRGIHLLFSTTNTVDELNRTLIENHNSLGGDDFWVIEIEGPKTEIISYINSKDFCTIIKDKRVRIRPIFTDKEKKKHTIKASSINDIISQYIDVVYSGGLDKVLLKSKALNLLDKLPNIK